MVRVIAIISGKGGVGKTTTAANLGVSLAYDYHKDVVAIDANTTSSGLGLHLGNYHFKKTLNDVLKNRINIPEAIFNHPSGLKFIPSSTSINSIDADPAGIKRVVSHLEPYVDIILLDCPPTLGSETISGVDSANEIIIVANPDWASLLEARRVIDYANFKKKKIIGLVLNKEENVSEEFRQRVIDSMGIPIIASIPEDNAVIDSVTKRVPVVHLHPHSKAAKAYRKLIEEVTGEQFPRKFGIMSRIFG